MKGSTRGAISFEGGENGCGVDLFGADAAAKRVVVGKQPIDLRRQRRLLGEIDQAEGPPTDLVFVGGADAAAGRAQRLARIRAFAGDIELAMERQDERGVLGDQEVLRRDLDAGGADALHLVDERPWIEDDAVADDRELARTHHARRKQAQLVGDAIDDERMAGVMAALEANDDIRPLRQPVDDLALAFVAPLRSDDDHIRHFVRPPLETRTVRPHPMRPDRILIGPGSIRDNDQFARRPA